MDTERLLLLVRQVRDHIEGADMRDALSVLSELEVTLSAAPSAPGKECGKCGGKGYVLTEDWNEADCSCSAASGVEGALRRAGLMDVKPHDLDVDERLRRFREELLSWKTQWDEGDTEGCLRRLDVMMEDLNASSPPPSSSLSGVEKGLEQINLSLIGLTEAIGRLA